MRLVLILSVLFCVQGVCSGPVLAAGSESLLFELQDMDTPMVQFSDDGDFLHTASGNSLALYDLTGSGTPTYRISGGQGIASLAASKGGSSSLVLREFGMSDETLVFDGVDWKKKYPEHSPGVRYDCSMAFDKTNNVTVLFGGSGTCSCSYSCGTCSVPNDTWLWNGEDWESVNVQNPPTLRGHTMVYDESRQAVVLAGFIGEVTDTVSFFEWKGSGWVPFTEVFLDGTFFGPSINLAFDSDRQVLVAVVRESFYDSSMQSRDRIVTCEFDGQWKKDVWEDSPLGWSRETLYFDPLGKRLLLFAGTDNVWSWTGEEWVPVFSAYPARATIEAIVFDEARQETIAVPRFFDNVETMIWNGTRFIGLPSTNSFPARENFGLAYDAFRGEAVMFGGNYSGCYCLCCPRHARMEKRTTPESSPESQREFSSFDLAFSGVLSDDGSRIAVHEPCGVVVYDASWNKVWSFEDSAASPVQFSEDGSTLLFFSEYTGIIYDIDRNVELFRLRGLHRFDWGNRNLLSKDGRRYLHFTNDGQMFAFERSGDSYSLINHTPRLSESSYALVSKLALSRSGDVVAILANEPELERFQMRILEVASGEILFASGFQRSGRSYTNFEESASVSINDEGTLAAFGFPESASPMRSNLVVAGPKRAEPLLTKQVYGGWSTDLSGSLLAFDKYVFDLTDELALLPPLVTDVSYSPAVLAPGDIVTVTCSITSFDGVDNVLCYLLDREGGLISGMPLTDLGLRNDGQAGDGVFGGTRLTEDYPLEYFIMIHVLGSNGRITEFVTNCSFTTDSLPRIDLLSCDIEPEFELPEPFSNDPPDIIPSVTYILHPSLKNVGEATAENLKVWLLSPDSQMEVSLRNQVSIDSLAPGGEARIEEQTLTLTIDDAPGEYMGTVKVVIEDDRGRRWVHTVDIPATLDIRDPRLTCGLTSVSRVMDPGEEVSLQVDVEEASAIAQASAEFFDLDTKDLVHAGDLVEDESPTYSTMNRKYHCTWKTESTPRNYRVMVSVADVFGNSATEELFFTTRVPVPPLEVLLYIEGSLASAEGKPEYLSVLSSLGVAHESWFTDVHGTLTSANLMSTSPALIVWARGDVYIGGAGGLIKDYIDNGGDFVFFDTSTGYADKSWLPIEDSSSWYLWPDNVLDATGVTGNPVSEGLALSIAGNSLNLYQPVPSASGCFTADVNDKFVGFIAETPSRMAVFGFGLDQIVGEVPRARLMARTLNWFGFHTMADVNSNGRTDSTEMFLLGSSWGAAEDEANYRLNLSPDGIINGKDLLLMERQKGR